MIFSTNCSPENSEHKTLHAEVHLQRKRKGVLKWTQLKNQPHKQEHSELLRTNGGTNEGRCRKEQLFALYNDEHLPEQEDRGSAPAQGCSWHPG